MNRIIFIYITENTLTKIDINSQKEALCSPINGVGCNLELFEIVALRDLSKESN